MATEGEVLRYSAWRNTQALRDWHRRADAAHLNYAAHLHYANAGTRAESPAV